MGRKENKAVEINKGDVKNEKNEEKRERRMDGWRRKSVHRER